MVNTIHELRQITLTFGELSYDVRYTDSLGLCQRTALEEGQSFFQFVLIKGILHTPNVKGYSRAFIYEVASYIHQHETMYLAERPIYCYIKRMNGETHVS